MATKKVLEVGRKVPNVSLKDQNQQTFELTENEGQIILLSFHPLAWTPVCAEQMKALEKNYKTFQKLNAIALGISVDSVPCKNAWAKSLRISKTKMLADFWPHGGVAKMLGIFRDEGFSERANFIIDKDGRVAFQKIYPIAQLPDINEIIGQIEQLV